MTTSKNPAQALADAIATVPGLTGDVGPSFKSGTPAERQQLQDMVVSQWPALGLYMFQFNSLSFPPKDTPDSDPRWKDARLPIIIPSMLLQATEALCALEPEGASEKRAWQVARWCAHVIRALTPDWRTKVQVGPLTPEERGLEKAYQEQASSIRAGARTRLESGLGFPGRDGPTTQEALRL